MFYLNNGMAWGWGQEEYCLVFFSIDGTGVAPFNLLGLRFLI